MILDAVFLSLIAGLSIGLGGVVVAAFPRLGMRLYDTLLGLAADVLGVLLLMALSQIMR